MFLNRNDVKTMNVVLFTFTFSKIIKNVIKLIGKIK